MVRGPERSFCSTANAVHTNTKHKLYSFLFLFSTACFDHTYWQQSSGGKIQKEKYYRRDHPFTTNVLSCIKYYISNTDNKKKNYWQIPSTRGWCRPNAMLFWQQNSTYPHMTQMHQAKTITSYFFMIHFNSILPSVSRSSNFSVSFKFPNLNSLRTSLLHPTCHTPRPSHPPYISAP